MWLLVVPSKVREVGGSLMKAARPPGLDHRGQV